MSLSDLWAARWAFGSGHKAERLRRGGSSPSCYFEMGCSHLPRQLCLKAASACLGWQHPQPPCPASSQHHSALAFSCRANMVARVHFSSPCPGSLPPHASTDSARVSSREAQDFAPLMCNKKKATLPCSTRNPTSRSPRLGTLLPGCLLQLGSVWGLLRRVFLPLCKGTPGLCRHEMTDVSLHLGAHELSKLLQQQHGLAGITVLI